jgi:hypothetical protein
MTDRGTNAAAPDETTRLKIVLGLGLVILSFVLGKVAVPILAIWPTFSLLVYAISWIMLFVGASICGREGLHTATELYRRHQRRVIGRFRQKLM